MKSFARFLAAALVLLSLAGFLSAPASAEIKVNDKLQLEITRETITNKVMYSGANWAYYVPKVVPDASNNPIIETAAAAYSWQNMDALIRVRSYQVAGMAASVLRNHSPLIASYLSSGVSYANYAAQYSAPYSSTETLLQHIYDNAQDYLNMGHSFEFQPWRTVSYRYTSTSTGYNGNSYSSTITRTIEDLTNSYTQDSQNPNHYTKPTSNGSSTEHYWFYDPETWFDGEPGLALYRLGLNITLPRFASVSSDTYASVSTEYAVPSRVTANHLYMESLVNTRYDRYSWSPLAEEAELRYARTTQYLEGVTIGANKLDVSGLYKSTSSTDASYSTNSSGDVSAISSVYHLYSLGVNNPDGELSGAYAVQVAGDVPLGNYSGQWAYSSTTKKFLVLDGDTKYVSSLQYTPLDIGKSCLIEGCRLDHLFEALITPYTYQSGTTSSTVVPASTFYIQQGLRNPYTTYTLRKVEPVLISFDQYYEETGKLTFSPGNTTYYHPSHASYTGKNGLPEGYGIWKYDLIAGDDGKENPADVYSLGKVTSPPAAKYYSNASMGYWVEDSASYVYGKAYQDSPYKAVESPGYYFTSIDGYKYVTKQFQTVYQVNSAASVIFTDITARNASIVNPSGTLGRNVDPAIFSCGLNFSNATNQSVVIDGGIVEGSPCFYYAYQTRYLDGGKLCTIIPHTWSTYNESSGTRNTHTATDIHYHSAALSSSIGSDSAENSTVIYNVNLNLELKEGSFVHYGTASGTNALKSWQGLSLPRKNNNFIGTYGKKITKNGEDLTTVEGTAQADMSEGKWSANNTNNVAGINNGAWSYYTYEQWYDYMYGTKTAQKSTVYTRPHLAEGSEATVVNYNGGSALIVERKDPSIVIDWEDFPGFDLDLDLSAPIISVVKDPTGNKATDKVTLTITATDPNGNDSATPISINGGAFVASPATYVVTENETVNIVARDEKGNIREYNVNITNIDETEPYVTGVTQNTNAWTKGPVTVSVHAQDDVSLHSEGAYKFKFTPNSAVGGASTETGWQTSNAYKVTENGTVTVTVRDATGKTAIYSHEVSNIDLTPPDFKATLSPPTTTKVSAVEGVTVELELINTGDPVTGDGSNLHATAIKWDPDGAWTNETARTFHDNQILTIQVRDSLGNVSNPKTVAITNISTSKPVIDSFTGDNLRASYVMSPVTLTVTAHATEGALHAKPYSWDGGATWTTQSSMKVTYNGEYSVIVRDTAGNTAEASYIVANIDSVAPSAAVHLYRGIPDNWYEDNTEAPTTDDYVWKLKVEASDVGSGVALIQTLWDSGTVSGTAYASSAGLNMDIQEPGTYAIIVSDKAGNQTYAEKIVTHESIGLSGTGMGDAYVGISVPSDGSAGSPFASSNTNISDLVYGPDGAYNTKTGEYRNYEAGKEGVIVHLVANSKSNRWITGTATFRGVEYPVKFLDSTTGTYVEGPVRGNTKLPAMVYIPISGITQDVINQSLNVVFKEWGDRNATDLEREGSATLYVNAQVNPPNLQYTYNRSTREMVLVATSAVAGIKSLKYQQLPDTTWRDYSVTGPFIVEDGATMIVVQATDNTGQTTELRLDVSTLAVSGGTGGSLPTEGIDSASGTSINSYYISGRTSETYIIGGTKSNTNNIPASTVLDTILGN